MSDSKAVFIDFDGTYADHGVVPPAHVETVRAARVQGHRVFLCTGRPKSMVEEAVHHNVFDGLVCSAGGYAEMDGQVLSDIRFPDEIAERLVTLLEAHNVLFMLEAPLATYAVEGTIRALEQVLTEALRTEEGPRAILAAVEPVASLHGLSFGKATCFAADTPLRELAGELGDEVALLPSSLDLGHGAGEFYLPHVTKAVGIEAVSEHLGLVPDDIIAIGDGYNDLEMLAHAGVGVAVRSAPPEVLREASLLMAPPQENGLVDIFRALGLTGSRS